MNLAKIKELYRKANINLDEIPERSRPGWVTVVRRAKDELEGELQNYLNRVRSNSLAIILQGERKDVEDFAELAKVITDTPTVNVNAFYGPLANKLFSSQGGRNGIAVIPSHHETFMMAVSKLERELDILQMPRPEFIPGFTLRTHDDAMRYVRTSLAKKVGSDLTNVMINKLLVPAALDSDYDEGVFAFTLAGVLPEEATAVTSGFKHVFVISVDSDPTEEYVHSEFEKVKASLSPKKKPGRPKKPDTNKEDSSKDESNTKES